MLLRAHASPPYRPMTTAASTSIIPRLTAMDGNSGAATNAPPNGNPSNHQPNPVTGNSGNMIQLLQFYIHYNSHTRQRIPPNAARLEDVTYARSCSTRRETVWADQVAQPWWRAMSRRGSHSNIASSCVWPGTGGATSAADA